MKKNRLIFFAVFAAYHLVIFFFTLYIRSKQDSPFELYPVLTHISSFLWGSLLGLVLLIADFVWTWKTGRNSNRVEEAMRLENNTLKAKIYDLTEGKKTATVVPPTH